MLVRPHKLKTVAQALPFGSHTVLTRGELFVATYFSFYALRISINARLKVVLVVRIVLAFKLVLLLQVRQP